ncbi:HAMP domain-containing sensor histidine kinase [Psychromarinibacter sp. C21-152]|uniref:histidine kinase n=1 Tax=Psychromarinibacter sediminicola TaxID=3033385 RepID=A0AAE3T9R3_9RHOB|nr:HAMP domain-containing sensor histidine kinase [Psychromarinibacter sediminicola]MDF0602900.1 HAMP domain-containing sensor histidine kinase [Psychromarinibacter sediminicola]
MLRRFDAWPITIRVALATAVLMVLLGLAASQQVLSTLGRLQDARLREYARLHVEGLAVALGPFALHKDVWEVYDTLDRARTNASGQRILFTVVADDRGSVLAATDPTRAPVDSGIDAFVGDAVPVGEVSAANGSSVVRVTAPLSVQGRDVGQIVTELDVADLVAQRRGAALALLAGNAIATLMLALAGYFVMSRMLKPVELLAGHMGKAGGTPHPIPEAAIPRSNSVLTRLLRNFNDMAGAIDARTEAERRLAERERFVSLGRLSSSLAHEINNPLGGLLNTTDTIRTYADRPNVVRQSVELLDRGLRHLRDVSRAILEENRMDRSGQSLSRSDFEDLRLLFEPETIRRRQRLDWRIDGSDDILGRLPSAPIRQVALNLLLNASSAAPEGGSVSMRIRETEDTLELSVTDDGPGLSDTARTRLLSEAPVAPGGGVGLRLVRDLVTGLDGTIACDRSEGTTEITVRLPRRRAAEPC